MSRSKKILEQLGYEEYTEEYVDEDSFDERKSPASLEQKISSLEDEIDHLSSGGDHGGLSTKLDTAIKKLEKLKKKLDKKA